MSIINNFCVKLATFFLAFSFLFSVANNANATLLVLNGGNFFVTSSNHSYAGSGWVGRTNLALPLSLSTTQNNVLLTFEYLYRESPSFTNSFNVAGGTPSSIVSVSIPNNTAVSSPPTSTLLMPTAGLIPFNFSNIIGTVANGSSALVDTIFSFPRIYSFMITFNDPFSSAKSNFVPSGSVGSVAWILMDSNPLVTDFDYDDMVIRVTATLADAVNVVEPNSLLLFLTGSLGLFGLLVTRNNKILQKV